MAKKNNGLTHQGIRNLDNIGAKRVEKNPSPQKSEATMNCPHKRKAQDGLSGDTYCRDCDAWWDQRGKQY